MLSVGVIARPFAAASSASVALLSRQPRRYMQPSSSALFASTSTASEAGSSNNNNSAGNHVELRPVSRMRTLATNRIWQARMNQMNLLDPKQTGFQPHRIIPKRMKDSLFETWLDFKSNEEIREEYLNVYGGIRLGRIFEDLDAAAGTIAYLHSDDGDIHTVPPTIVTASVDRIDLINTLSADQDVKISGNVTYCGFSSMEVVLKVEGFENKNDPNSKKTPILLAKFVMVARNAATGKAFQVNPLIIENEEERRIFMAGEDHKNRKRADAEQSLQKTPPTEEERFLIHDLYLQYQAYQDPKISAEKPKNIIWMEDTVLNSLRVCQPQDRNIHQKVFGGFLMREAYELAYANASLFAHRRPYFLALDDITFRKPVPIGSILNFRSQVIFAPGHPQRSFLVSVIADVIDPITGSRDTTNTFHFTFTTKAENESEEFQVPGVLPRSYADSIKYLEGKRLREKGVRIAKAQKSTFAKEY